MELYSQSRATVSGYQDKCKECTTLYSKMCVFRKRGKQYDGKLLNLKAHNSRALRPYKFNKKEITTVKLISVNHGGEYLLSVKWNKNRTLIMLEITDWNDMVVEQYGTAPAHRSKTESIEFFKDQLIDLLKKKALRVLLESGNDILIYGIEERIECHSEK